MPRSGWPTRRSWIVTSTNRGERQTAYQILVAGSEAALAADGGDVADLPAADHGGSLAQGQKLSLESGPPHDRIVRRHRANHDLRRRLADLIQSQSSQADQMF